jgi:hypothetical protein
MTIQFIHLPFLKVEIFHGRRYKRSLEVKFPTIWTYGQTEVGRVREEKGRRKKIREEKRRQMIQARKNIPVWRAPPPGAKVFRQKTG